MFDGYRAKQPGASLGQMLFFDFGRITCRLVLSLFFGLRTRHQERVPARGPLLIAANHESYLDPPAIGCAITQRHMTFVARAGLFKFKPFAWLITNVNSVPLRENEGDAAAIREIIRRLEMGRAVMIFPEGGRTPDGELHEFKRGVAVLVKRAKCPVVPAAICGAYEAWPRHRPWPLPFVRPVRVIYGQPIPYDELMKDGPDAALERIRAEVARLRTELRSACE